MAEKLRLLLKNGYGLIQNVGKDYVKCIMKNLTQFAHENMMAHI